MADFNARTITVGVESNSWRDPLCHSHRGPAASISTRNEPTSRSRTQPPSGRTQVRH